MGLEFQLCFSEHITASFGAVTGTVWYGSATIGTSLLCPASMGRDRVMAVDVDGDQRADGWFGDFDNRYCNVDCGLADAADLDGDGWDEILTLEEGGTTPSSAVYVVAPDGHIRPADVVASGTGPNVTFPFFTVGQTARFWTGQDEGAFAVTCTPSSSGAVFVQVAATFPTDSAAAGARIDTTRLRFVDGGFTVESFDSQADVPTPVHLPPTGGCGLEFPDY